MARSWGQKQPLVEKHIKDVGVGVIENHLDCFRRFVGHGKSGIYVLRKDKIIYYVGLASSLRSRLATHIKNHHRGKWNQFDLYIVKRGKRKYLVELEALLIRVAKPKGNRTEPRFIKHHNVTKQFKKALQNEASQYFPGLRN